jgi:hypothetical protein
VSRYGIAPTDDGGALVYRRAINGPVIVAECMSDAAARSCLRELAARELAANPAPSVRAFDDADAAEPLALLVE